jgi:aspartyl-tRNA(Asn)/glutamyl-tRNA(Gln) amidotransferase subunit A
MNDTAFSSLTDLARGLKKRTYSSRELTQMFLDRIALYDDKAHAYVDVYRESALLQAQAADLQRQAGLPLPPLHGLPIAVKDLCDIEGRVTAAGSLAWKARRSTVTSAVVERLQAAGMIILGKTHTVEFAFGGWGTNPHMGTPRNPWDWSEHHRIPGGSSSGSAVAVAAGLAPVAIGSDTGGSVRVPSALNGLTGLKTSRGLISLYGTVPLSATLDTIGPLARTAEDAAMVTQALAGYDPRDPTTRECPRDAIAPTRAVSLRHLRIAVMQPKQYPWPVADDVHQATEEAAGVFQSLGARVESVEIPVDFAELMRNNGTITAAEGYRLHVDYIEDPELPFGPAVKKRIINGKSVNASAYLAALAHRRETIARFNDWMQAYDCLLTPSVPFAACPLHEVDEDSTAIVAFGRPVNYLNACALAVPAGFSDEGLPIGVQLIAKPYQENLLLQAGNSFQNVTDWHRRRPPELP